MRSCSLTWMVMLLAGCGANHDAVFRTFDAYHGQSIAVDAKQRLAISSVRNGFSNASGAIADQVVVCTEPSPDALSVLGASFGGSASEAQKLAISVAASSSESGESIGLRTQTIQILRDSMFRLCEGYQSGALSPEAFERLQRRYINAMLGLLAIEQLTGVVTPKPVQITANAPAYPNLNQSATAGADKPKDGASGSSEGVPATGGAGNVNVQGPLAGQNVTLSIGSGSNQKSTEAGNQASTAGASANAGGSPTSGVQTETAAKVAQVVLDIVDDILKTDYSAETCLNFVIDDASSHSEDNKPVLDYCRQLLSTAVNASVATKLKNR